MKIAVGFDHAGFPLKETVLDTIRAAGHEPIDMGTNSTESVDFPDYSEKVGRAVRAAKPVAAFWSVVQAWAVHCANKIKASLPGFVTTPILPRKGSLTMTMNVLCFGAR
jgi:ribose 5-phosphate isomerase B